MQKNKYNLSGAAKLHYRTSKLGSQRKLLLGIIRNVFFFFCIIYSYLFNCLSRFLSAYAAYYYYYYFSFVLPVADEDFNAII